MATDNLLGLSSGIYRVKIPIQAILSKINLPHSNFDMHFKPVVVGSSPTRGIPSLAQLVERSIQPKEEGKDTEKKV